MAGPPPVWPLFSSVLSPTGASARYGVPAPTGGLQSPDRAVRKRAPGKGPAVLIEFRPRRSAPKRPAPRHPAQLNEVRFMSRLSHIRRDRGTARERRVVAAIWASFLVFVFVAGIASRIWLR